MDSEADGYLRVKEKKYKLDGKYLSRIKPQCGLLSIKNMVEY